MKKQPVYVVIPAVLDPTDPSVLLQIKIDIQNIPSTNPLETSISILDENGKLRKFEEIQAEYAEKAIGAMGGNASRVAELSGVSRQTLRKWGSAR